MRRYQTGDPVKAGFYFNLRDLEPTVVTKDGEPLPGDAGTRAVKVPLPVMLALAPVMGGLLVMFLPLVGFVLVVVEGTRQIALLGHRVALAIEHAWHRA